MSKHCLAAIAAIILAVPAAVFGQANGQTSGQASDTTPVNAPLAGSPTPASPTKSPGLATALSVVIPGAGQMYAGKVGKGLGLLIVGTGALAIGTTIAIESFCIWNCPRGANTDWPMELGAAVYIGTWGYSIYSAHGDALEYNKRHQRHAARVRPIIQLGSANRFTRTPHKFGINVEL